eukprot:TRINITY_DN10964_c0_g1_i1.p1 TRINITY_DN10964_c0_g1~~TRINITY_DN10964_c0_g1_i1.p1  ORF type:complete len:339 (+),score=64.43 TRINITY_DN10964_c0_g1_i1:150-1019(+)
MHSLVSMILVTGIIRAYYLSCTTNAGNPPIGWQPDTESSPMSSSKRRYCNKCNAFKPPRCHHCRACNKCIMKMDHHCPWINNCVGHNNHKFFILFLLYVVVAITYACVMVTILFLEVIQHLSPSTFHIGQIITFAVFACLIAPLGLAIGGLGGWQVWLIAQNMTTVENEIYYSRRHPRRRPSHPAPVPYTNTTAQTAQTDSDTQGISHAVNIISYDAPSTGDNSSSLEDGSGSGSGHDRDNDDGEEGNPYDLGSIMENLKVVFGRNRWTWLLPVKANLDEGDYWRKRGH